jgi:hypothetical protein
LIDFRKWYSEDNSRLTNAETPTKDMSIGDTTDYLVQQFKLSVAAKPIAQRIVNAQNSFIDSVQEQFGFSKQDAEKYMISMQKTN